MGITRTKTLEGVIDMTHSSLWDFEWDLVCNNETRAKLRYTHLIWSSVQVSAPKENTALYFKVWNSCRK